MYTVTLEFIGKDINPVKNERRGYRSS
jgi:hypothetical protein